MKGNMPLDIFLFFKKNYLFIFKLIFIVEIITGVPFIPPWSPSTLLLPLLQAFTALLSVRGLCIHAYKFLYAYKSAS